MTSKSGAKSVAAVAADANVILSAVTGGAALRVFTRGKLKIHTTESTLAEVEEYLPAMAARARLPVEALESQLRMLRLRVWGALSYRRVLPEALRRIGRRDPDDADLLALSIKLRIPVWSNDRDFQDARVRLFTTARLLKVLNP